MGEVYTGAERRRRTDLDDKVERLGRDVAVLTDTSRRTERIVDRHAEVLAEQTASLHRIESAVQHGVAMVEQNRTLADARHAQLQRDLAPVRAAYWDGKAVQRARAARLAYWRSWAPWVFGALAAVGGAVAWAGEMILKWYQGK